MVRANTPGQNNGEVKFWIDGTVVGDFPNLNVRSISTLKIDEAIIGLHAGHTERINKKWYVVSRHHAPVACSALASRHLGRFDNLE
jgi:hypothetical protein